MEWCQIPAPGRAADRVKVGDYDVDGGSAK